MSQTIELSDELYRALERYAAEHQQTPEEALASLLQGTQPQSGNPLPTSPVSGSEHPLQIVKAASEDTSEYIDPWEGFRGKYTADVPDLTLNHDKYLAEAYMDTHDDDDCEYLDPLEGFHGMLEAKYPDLIERHDYYIGQEALATHEDDDQPA
jgi:hypothetical protein